MKTMILSNHTGDMIAREDRQRQERHEAAMSKYRSESARRARQIDSEYQSLKAAYVRESEAWRRMSWLSKFAYGVSNAKMAFLSCLIVMVVSLFALITNPSAWFLSLCVLGTLAFTVMFFPTRSPKPPSRERIGRRYAEPTQPRISTSSERQRVWQAGSEGERRVLRYLSGRLDDDWTLISGYRGPGGEIDQILIGPLGICALEIKYLNGTVFVRGDRWKLDKYDNYGNLVESGQLVMDGGGRSPSSQINGAVGPLETFLSKRKQIKRISRAVILTHDKSRIGRVEQNTVNHIGVLTDLSVDKLFPRSAPLDRAATDSIVTQIQRDHQFHKKRSRGRRRRR